MNENMRLKYQAHFLSQGSKFLYLVALFLNQIGCPGNALQEGKKKTLVFYLLSTTGKWDKDDNSCDKSQHSD